jgi:cell division septation protein DedD
VESAEEAVAEGQPAESAAATEQPSEEPPVVSMVAPPGGKEQEEMEVQLPGPGLAAAEQPSAEGSRLASPEEEPPLSGEMPLAAAAPESAPAAEVAAAPAAPSAAAAKQPAGETTAFADLPRRSYFVQLGAYSTQGLAEKLANRLRGTYEVIVLAVDSTGRMFYKVLVGPLNRDESGTLLYQFRARGFKDAFVQYVE